MAHGDDEDYEYDYDYDYDNGGMDRVGIEPTTSGFSDQRSSS